MPIRVSENLERRRLEIERCIRRAFKGVRRGPVSWSKAEAIDGNASSHEMYEAGARDTDTCWQDLLQSKSWTPHSNVGGWFFLDAMARRYYLPAAMIWCMNFGDADGIETGVGLVEELSRQQSGAVAAFVLWMRDYSDWMYAKARKQSPGLPRVDSMNPWRSMFRDRWREFA